MYRSECLSACNILFLVFTVGLYGCSGGDPNKGIDVKPTVPVTGKVLVDGEPPPSTIQVKAWRVGNADATLPSASRGGTLQDGVFKLTTYSDGDGVPAGEYKLTFEWGKLNVVSPGRAGLDQLGGQYSDPQNSQFTFTATETDDELDLGVFKLEKAAEPTFIPDDRR